MPVLPADLTIHGASDLLQQCLVWLVDTGAPQVIAVDARAVVQVDAAGLQLLVALSIALNRKDRGLQLVAPSDTFVEGCHRFGLSSWLGDVTVSVVH